MQKYYCKHGKKNATGCQCHCDCTLTWCGGEKYGWRETPLLMPLHKIRREAPCSRSKIQGASLCSPPGVELYQSLVMHVSLTFAVVGGPIAGNPPLRSCSPASRSTSLVLVISSCRLLVQHLHFAFRSFRQIALLWRLWPALGLLIFAAKLHS